MYPYNHPTHRRNDSMTQYSGPLHPYRDPLYRCNGSLYRYNHPMYPCNGPIDGRLRLADGDPIALKIFSSILLFSLFSR